MSVLTYLGVSMPLAVRVPMWIAGHQVCLVFVFLVIFTAVILSTGIYGSRDNIRDVGKEVLNARASL